MSLNAATLLKKANESLRAAQILLDEDLSDIAASRAYYTMFYVAEAFLLQAGLSFSRHSAVIARFGQEFAKPNKVAKKVPSLPNRRPGNTFTG